MDFETSRNAGVFPPRKIRGPLRMGPRPCARCDRDVCLGADKTKINDVKYRILAHCQSISVRFGAILTRCRQVVEGVLDGSLDECGHLPSWNAIAQTRQR